MIGPGLLYVRCRAAVLSTGRSAALTGRRMNTIMMVWLSILNPSAVTMHHSRFISLLLPVLLLASCAAPPVAETARRVASPNLPPDGMLDLQVALLLGDSATRRQARGAEDLEAWLDSWWAGQDPTPSTPENEARQVYRERTRFLIRRFPDTAFGDWPIHWIHFLVYGPPDSRGPEFVPWMRPEEERARTSSVFGYLRERFKYGSPAPFQLVIYRDDLIRDATQEVPEVPPSLEGVWELLEDPSSSVIDRRHALTTLSWYELPEVVERLLAIPESRWTTMPDIQQEAFLRLARRLAYRHPTEEIRRLAALGAAGASATGQMRRAAAPAYGEDLFQADIRALSDRQYWLPRSPNRGPHPRIWTDPEGLLSELVVRFRDEDTLTGWDWRGDVHLMLGPPAFLDLRNRQAHFLWGTPEVYGISSTMLGWAEAFRQLDYLGQFVTDVQQRDEAQQQEAEAASRTLSRALGATGGEASVVSESLLQQLQVLAPPNVFRVSLPENAPHVRLQIDIVAFPTEGDSVEVQASFGIPADDVRFEEDSSGWATSLKANLVLVDRQLRVRRAITRQEGYRIGGSGPQEGMSFLDVFRFKAEPGSYIAYLSAEDPRTDRQGGILVSVDLTAMSGEQFRVSPILLAADIRPAAGEDKFNRGDLQILPVPSRQFMPGRDLHVYFELDDLSRSEVGDYSWDESYFIIPDTQGEGIVRIQTGEQHTSLTPLVRRNIAIDLSGLSMAYSGPVFVVVLATDEVSGRQAVGATRFILLPGSEEPPPAAR
jgi:hypothetical protein